MNVSITSLIKLVRPLQWLKNGMLFFPPFLGGIMQDLGSAQKGIVPFVAFCMISSGTYVINDLCDLNADRNHPKKRFRPVASGETTIGTASLIAILFLGCGLYIGSTVSGTFLVYQLMYMVISLSYSLKLKEIPVIDLFCISAGFLIRLQAGGTVFGIAISNWLFLSVFLLALFLSTGKRLGEKNALKEMAGTHRKSLDSYPPGFLDGTMYMTGSAVLVTYTMYAITHRMLIFTVPICFFGLLRYIFRVKSGMGGDPTDSLLRDPVLFMVGLCWAGLVAWGIYG